MALAEISLEDVQSLVREAIALSRNSGRSRLELAEDIRPAMLRRGLTNEELDAPGKGRYGKPTPMIVLMVDRAINGLSQANGGIISRPKRITDGATVFVEASYSGQAPDPAVSTRLKSKTARDELYDLQGGVCMGCGESLPLRQLQVDHIVPRSEGGPDCWHNWQLLCGPCNSSKGRKSMIEFLASRRSVS